MAALQQHEKDLKLPKDRPLIVAVVLFDGFELLDIAAPVELLQAERSKFRLLYCVAGNPNTPRYSSCMKSLRGDNGPAFQPTNEMVFNSDGMPLLKRIEEQNEEQEGNHILPDIILIPGGIGVRRIVSDKDHKDPDDTSLLKNWIEKACIHPSTNLYSTINQLPH